MALLALSLSAPGPVATATGKDEMGMIPAPQPTTPAPQPTTASPLCKPTLDLAGPSLVTSTMAGPGESGVTLPLSFPANPWGLKQPAHSSASEAFTEAGNTFASPLKEVGVVRFAVGTPAATGMDSKPAGSAPAGTVGSQPAQAQCRARTPSTPRSSWPTPHRSRRRRRCRRSSRTRRSPRSPSTTGASQPCPPRGSLLRSTTSALRSVHPPRSGLSSSTARPRRLRQSVTVPDGPCL